VIISFLSKSTACLSFIGHFVINQLTLAFVIIESKSKEQPLKDELKSTVAYVGWTV